jgi:DnaJ-domain-containing protein 1
MVKSSLQSNGLCARPNKNDLLIFSFCVTQDPLLHSATIVTAQRLPGPLEIAQMVYEHTARGHRGLIEVETAKGLLRLQLGSGFVWAIDVGPHAPVGPDSQVRYLLRARGFAKFRLGHTLSGLFSVDPFRPDAGIRQHVEAQVLSTERLRERLGHMPVTVSLPPHPSALLSDEREIVSWLAHGHTIEQLLAKGSLPPSRLLRLLVFLDALGVLVIGLSSGPLAAAYALLELPASATRAEVKSAYRRLAKALHPDQFPSASASELRALSDRFAAVSAAYRLLVESLAGRGE